MKISVRILTKLAMTLCIGLLASCSFTLNGNQAKGRVLVGAPQAGSQAARAMAEAAASLRASGAPKSALKAPAIPAASRSAMRSRDLSASTDIASISFRVTNLDPYSGEADLEDYLDPTYPWIDLWLTPGESYRIVVSVTPTAAAPGSSVGVTMYGDQQDFTVDPNGYDTYVDLFVHPTQALVFNHFEVISGTPTQLQPFDPASGNWATMRNLFSTPRTVSPEDKFFYGATGKLYYFSYNDQKVYEWKTLSTPISPAPDAVVDAATDLGSYLILAICPDPTWPDSFWIVGTNGTVIKYFFRDINDSSRDFDSLDIKTTLQDGNFGSTVFVTGLAIDQVWHDAFITFLSYNTSSQEYHSGFVEYYGDSLQIPYIGTTAVVSLSADPSFSVLTDAAFAHGHLWTTASPMTTNASVGGVQTGKGTADIIRWDLDYYGIPVGGSYSPLMTSYATQPPYNSTPLWMPGKFLGPFQGTKIYFNQYDSSSSSSLSNEVSNTVDIDTWSVDEIWSIFGGA